MPEKKTPKIWEVNFEIRNKLPEDSLKIPKQGSRMILLTSISFDLCDFWSES